MHTLIFCFIALILQLVSACPQHESSRNGKRLYSRAPQNHEWSYDKCYNWGQLDPDYILCQIGTTQAPIGLSLNNGISRRHVPVFSDRYTSVPGHLFNWGYGVAFNVEEPEITARPYFVYDDTTLYLSGWHVHTPADHSVNGYSTRAELHLVHTFDNGTTAGVIAILIDPGLSESKFFSQIVSSPGAFPNVNSTEEIPSVINISYAISEANNIHEFWTYSGSLTSPPCTEGIRFWVGRSTLFLETTQLQEVLRVSAFSARLEQSVWAHDIN